MGYQLPFVLAISLDSRHGTLRRLLFSTGCEGLEDTACFGTAI